MAILGIGLDLVELARIGAIHARRGDAFVHRFCRPGEPQTRQGGAFIEHLGGLWAAKEAVLKALGTGWSQGLSLRQVEVVRSPAGAPGVRLHGAAARRLEALGASAIHLTITHERHHAAAVAILEGSALEGPALEGPASPRAEASPSTASVHNPLQANGTAS